MRIIMGTSVEKGPGVPEPEPEILAMDEPRKPSYRLYILFVSIFLAMTLAIAGNWGYISELAKEDREKPAISPMLTNTTGLVQRIKFTVRDDINLPISVSIRVHFWNVTNNGEPKDRWPINYSERMEVPQGTTIVHALRELPLGHPDMPYVGWYIRIDAKDRSGKNATSDGIAFKGQRDPGW